MFFKHLREISVSWQLPPRSSLSLKPQRHMICTIYFCQSEAEEAANIFSAMANLFGGRSSQAPVEMSRIKILMKDCRGVSFS